MKTILLIIVSISIIGFLMYLSIDLFPDMLIGFIGASLMVLTTALISYSRNGIELNHKANVFITDLIIKRNGKGFKNK